MQQEPDQNDNAAQRRQWRFLSGNPGPGEGMAARRRRMVEDQLLAREIVDERVLRVMGEVPRHLFVPPTAEQQAYEDRPLPIGRGQTISQPYIVALMTQLLHPRKEHRMLELGTGSGYQAAVLSELVTEVYSLELDEELANAAARRLENLGYRNVHVRRSDGFHGLEEFAPYDGIVVTCAGPEVPPPLLAQLRDGGRLVMPVGTPDGVQQLQVVQKRGDQDERLSVAQVRFVPLRREPPAPQR